MGNVINFPTRDDPTLVHKNEEDNQYFRVRGVSDGQVYVIPIHVLKEYVTGKRDINDLGEQVIRRALFEWMYMLGVKE